MAALWCLKLCGARAGVGRLENKALRGHLESKGFVRVISAPLRGGAYQKPSSHTLWALQTCPAVPFLHACSWQTHLQTYLVAARQPWRCGVGSL